MSVTDRNEDMVSFLDKLQAEVNMDFLSDLDRMLDEHFDGEVDHY